MSKILRLYFSVLFFSSALQATLKYVDFDTSMQVAAYEQIIQSNETQRRTGIPTTALLDFFRVLYEKNNFATIARDNQQRVPKIIHQIWIGDGVPEKFKAFQESWRSQHPDWEYRLWTQDDLATRDWYNADLLEKSRNPGEISDIMRYEILYHFGGVYIDFDFECLQPLDELHSLYDFYIGIQPLDSEFLQLGIGLIGCVPQHPILKAAIEYMRPTWADLNNAGNAPAKTGPIYFTKIFFMMADSCGMRDIALPAHYFYPLACNQEDFFYEQWLADGAFGVHHWAKSWLLPQFRKSEFRELQ